MSTLLERCAYAFASDLPEGESILSEPLRALVDRMRDDAPDEAALDAALRQLDLTALMALQAQFMEQYGVDLTACVGRPLRIGERDHFLFEDGIRRERLTAALEEGDLDRVAKLWTTSSGSHSPLFRRGVSPDSVAQWPVLDILADASLTRDGAKARSARQVRDGISSALRDRTRILTPAIRAVIRRLTGRTRSGGNEPPSAPPQLTVRALRPLAGINTVLVDVPAGLAGDRLVVRPAYPTQGVVLLVDPATGTLAASIPAEPGAAVSCRAYSTGGEPLDVVVALLNANAESATATVSLAAVPVVTLPLVTAGATAHTAFVAPAPPPPPTATPFGAAPPSHPSPASLTTDPNLQRALSRFFAQDAVSDTDLFTIGGAMLIARWAAEFPRIARRAGLPYVMEVGPGGKVYRVGV